MCPQIFFACIVTQAVGDNTWAYFFGKNCQDQSKQRVSAHTFAGPKVASLGSKRDNWLREIHSIQIFPTWGTHYVKERLDDIRGCLILLQVYMYERKWSAHTRIHTQTDRIAPMCGVSACTSYSFFTESSQAPILDRILCMSTNMPPSPSPTYVASHSFLLAGALSWWCSEILLKTGQIITNQGHFSMVKNRTQKNLDFSGWKFMEILWWARAFLDFCRSPFEVVSFMGELFGRSRTVLFLLLRQVSATLFLQVWCASTRAQYLQGRDCILARMDHCMSLSLCPVRGFFVCDVKGLGPASLWWCRLEMPTLPEWLSHIWLKSTLQWEWWNLAWPWSRHDVVFLVSSPFYRNSRPKRGWAGSRQRPSGPRGSDKKMNIRMQMSDVVLDGSSVPG